MSMPGEWSDIERGLFEDMAAYDPDIIDDHMLQTLYDTAMFDWDICREERDYAYNALVEYLWTEYGLDFEDVFDWEAYREAYDNAA